MRCTGEGFFPMTSLLFMRGMPGGGGGGGIEIDCLTV